MAPPRIAPLPAEAHANHAAAEAALAVCLQQPIFRGPEGRVAITLLAVSKRLAALVAHSCAGALSLSSWMDKPAHADALASWLFRHGALLADLRLRWCGHLAREHAQPSKRLRTRVIPYNYTWHRQVSTVLPALAALRQLTRLVIWVPDEGPSQLPAQHLPAQLQQLELLGNRRHATADQPWLALEHVTGLTTLRVPGACVDGGVLPCGLCSLAVADVSNIAPLQPLAQLTALQLDSCGPSGSQLRQLSMLCCLEQLSVQASTPSWSYQAGDFSNALAALDVLPLTHISTKGHVLTAACLAHLGACTRLTWLQLHAPCLADDATPEQLAAAVARMTALERLELRVDNEKVAGVDTFFDTNVSGDDTSSDADAAGDESEDADLDWSPVCKALAQLPRLALCDLCLTCLGPHAAAQLVAATQLTELHVWFCHIGDSTVATICTGLTGLRHLGVHCGNATDECLSSIAGMPRLVFVDLRRTAVTDSGVQQLSAARPSLQVRWR